MGSGEQLSASLGAAWLFPGEQEAGKVWGGGGTWDTSFQSSCWLWGHPRPFHDPGTHTLKVLLRCQTPSIPFLPPHTRAILAPAQLKS